MSSYTITIAPDDQSKATTTIRVDVTDTAARITEVLVRAGEGDGLNAGQLPALDLNQLLRAVSAATSPANAPVAIEAAAPAAPPAPPAPVVIAPPAQATTARPAPAASVDESPQVVLAAAQPPTPAVKAPQKSAAPKKTPALSPRKSAAPKKTAAPEAEFLTAESPKAQESEATAVKTEITVAKPAKAKAAKSTKRVARTTAAKTPAAKASVAGADSGRTYRRAPEDLEAVFRQAGNAAAIADHYGVPKHTAYAWIRTLRSKDSAPANS